jgi:phospholipid/cholesterol/gamma-HCH transport system substrate-binding protein
MTTKTQKLRVGVFTASAIALAALVLIVFGGLRFWQTRDHYKIVFPKSVMGLDEGALVYLAGIHVGTVDSIDISHDDLRSVVVSISVDHGTPIHVDTEAHLEYAGITGLKVIDLQGGSYAAPQVPEGGVIIAGEGVLEKFQHQAEQLVDESQTIMKHADQIVDNLVTITEPARFAAIDQILAQANVTATNLAATSDALHGMVGENRVMLHQSLIALRDTATSANELLDGPIAQLAANGNDLVSQVKTFVTANQGPLRAALFDLKQASRSFKELAREVRQRPSRLLFSPAPQERRLP